MSESWRRRENPGDAPITVAMTESWKQKESARQPMLAAAASVVPEEPLPAGPLEPPAAPPLGPAAAPPPPPAGPLFRFSSASDRWLLRVGGIGCLVAGASQPVMALWTKDIFRSVYFPNDDGSMYPSVGPHTQRDAEVRHSCLRLLVLAGSVFLSVFLASFTFNRVSENQVFTLRLAVFGRLVEKEVAWYDAHTPGGIATRFSMHMQGLRDGTGDALRLFIGALFMSLLGFAAAFVQDWQMALVLLAAVPFMVITLGCTVRIVTRLSKAEYEMHAKAGAVADTALALVRTVAAFGGFDRELRRYETRLREAERMSIRQGFASGFCMGAISVTLYGTFALGFYFGTHRVLEGAKQQCWLHGSGPPFGDCFTGSTMIATIFAILYGSQGLSGTGPFLTAVSLARAASGHICTLVDEPPAFGLEDGEVPDCPPEGELEFRDVCFSYPSRPEVKMLDSLSLKIKAGSTVALVGPSGAGKSTVIALLQRFYDPQSGAVLLDGLDIRMLNLAWVRRHMALVQQEPVLFAGTILENILYGRSNATAEEAMAAATTANAHSFIMTLPEGYETVLGDRGTQLSGGQKQRVAIARAVLRSPTVLLLDEATSALDSQSERVVQEALDKLPQTKRMTTVIVAHRLSTVQHADQLFVIQAGRVVQQGTHSELMAAEGSLYFELVSSRAQADASPSRARGGANADAEPEPVPERPLPTVRWDAVSREEGDAYVPLPEDQLSDASSFAREETALGGTALSAIARSPAAKPASAVPAPMEEEQDISVSSNRLWSYSKGDCGAMTTMLLGLLLLAATLPLLGLFISLASSVISPAPARFDPDTQTWIENLDPDKVLEQSTNFCLIFSALGVATAVSALTTTWTGKRVDEAMKRRLRTDMFRAFLRQEIAWFDRRTTGILSERLAADPPLMKAYTFDTVATFGFSTVSLALGLGLALSTSWQLTASLLLLAPVLWLGNCLAKARLQRTHESEAAALLSEVVANIRTVAAFGLQQRMAERYRALLARELVKDRRITVATNFAEAYESTIPFLIYPGLVYVSNELINQGLLSPAGLMSILFLLLFCAGSLGPVTKWQRSRAKAHGAKNRIFGIIERVPPIDPYSEGGRVLFKAQGRIEMRSVVFAYPSRPEAPVLRGTDLTLDPGSTTALVGASGCGKSTVTALLLRFYDPLEGCVRFDGTDIRELNLRWLRSQMALVQQEPLLFGGTILDNIAYGKEGATEAEVMEAAAAANAHGFVATLPSLYDTDVGHRGSQLSGGQKQRIAIARAIVRRPALLLLDEATSALDLESERLVQDALDKLFQAKSMTTLVIAHRLSTVQNADQICVLSRGVVVESGRHEELMAQPNGAYRSLVSHQLSGAT